VQSHDGIPALVVSGFLGSGKTTLVRRLLEDAQARGLRMAVVSNEFGELGIDEALLGEGGQGYVELAGGCVCCKLSDELSETLDLLYHQVSPDRVVVETSGVALPFETQLAFWRPPVDAWVSDDAAVVVVDAEQLAEGRELEGTFEHQVGSADLLLLNKLDLVDRASLPGLLARLEELSPGTPVIPCSHGQVPLDLLFPPDPEGLRARRRASSPTPAPHSHEHFSSQVLRFGEGCDEDHVRAELSAHKALRTKGFVRTSEGLRLVQGVGRRLELVPTEAPKDPALVGQVVVIVRESGVHRH
jgi:cobalamin biosynthesis protein CobW